MNESGIKQRRDGMALAVLVATALLLVLGGYLLFVNLGEYHIVDYDEARHGVNAYEMIRNQDYLVHTYAGETDYWNLKTPLSFWSIALGYRLFGYNAFAMRFFSALSTLLAMAAVTVWAWRRLGDIPALVTAALFVCSQGIYGSHFARFGDADSLYQLFFTLSMLCMLNSRRRFAWFNGSALCFALAFLVKATHALVIPLICFAYVLCTGRVRELTFKRILGLLAWGLLPILAWAVARYTRDGMAFFEKMLSTDVAGRVSSVAWETPVYGTSAWDAFKFFTIYMFEKYTPIWFTLGVLVVCAVICAVRRARPTREQADTLIGAALWLMLPIVMYSAMRTQYLWYTFSMFAALPVLAGAAVSWALNARLRRLWVGLGACAVAAALVVTVWPLVQRLTYMDDTQSYHELMAEWLDRDIDGGTHMYIQYNETKNDEPKTKWMPSDLLAAELLGDGVCLDGGADTFEADEEIALLIIARDQNMERINELMGDYSTREDTGYIYIFE